ncbi:vesicular inhibitory amino acid transporter [Hydra vulgaris]|uniref:Vesicular inhibitory amino acid transporter n=1 Tax=Hydra vulgaris TaxID=6087 RepID=A0ABM4CZJ5_HYDVU
MSENVSEVKQPQTINEEKQPKIVKNNAKTDETLTTTLEAVLTVCNTIQGLPILIIPYVFKTGGWWALLALLIIASFSSYTSIILVRSLYEVKNGVKLRVRQNYLDIGDAFWKGGGRMLVFVAMVIQLIFVSTMYPFIVGAMFNKSFPEANIPLWAWTLIGGLAFLPNSLLKDLSQVAWTGVVAMGCASIIFICLFIYCLMHFYKWDIDKMHNYQSLDFPNAIGILVACFFSQPFAPFIESTMKRPERFESAVKLSYFVMTSVIVFIGVVSHITFYPNSDNLLTNNLPSGIFRQTLNSIAAVLAFTSYTLPMFMLFEVVEKSHLTLSSIKKDTLSIYSFQTQVTRLTILFSTVIMAAFIPWFIYLLAFVGSFTGISLEFIFPALFHMKIYCAELKHIEFAIDVIIVFFGVLTMTISFIVSWVSLYACFTEDVC